MNLSRRLYIWRTFLARIAHRRGFGVQSPHDYELVRDVLFEPLPYYAYADLGLDTESLRQLWRICNHFPHVAVINERSQAAEEHYEQALKAGVSTIVVEHIHDENAAMWYKIVHDPRATLTFDMRRRGLILTDSKRIKQNYLL